MTLRLHACLVVVALTGCPSSNGDDDDINTCTDPRYGDGTCDVHLSCQVPDIDCFQTFESDTAAATWWTTTGGPLVGQTFPAVPTSDPRYTRMRTALDNGWDAFKTHRPVGLLADARPALVIVDKPMLQNAAFVVGDPMHDNQPFVVMVETPALALDVDDNAVLAVMMHELQHAVGLHKLGDVSDKLRAFYTAPNGSEPLGRDQADDPNVRTAGDAWRDGAAQVGPYSQIELGGLPLRGIFQDYLVAVANDGNQNNPNGCASSIQALGSIQSQLAGAEDPLDGTITADLSGAETPIANALQQFRDVCLAGQTFTVVDVGATLAHLTPAQYDAMLDAHDRALIDGKPFVDGLDAIVRDRRQAMRDAEDGFTEATGEPFERLRFFSYEEDADDVSEIVMAAAGLPPASAADFFLAVLPEASRTSCTNEPFPGYGVDLTDEHHATCWRIGHIEREAGERKRAMAHAIGSTPVTVRKPGRIPALPKPSDRIAN